MHTFKIKFLSLSALSIFILLSFYIAPEKVSALEFCNRVGIPTARVEIAGYGTFNSSGNYSEGSITVPSGTILNFTSYTFAEPSSPNSINYPVNQNASYVGPNRLGRSYVTSAGITANSQITIDITQNCDESQGLPEDMTYVIQINVAAPPTVNLSATPTSIQSGLSSLLSWTSTNADSCSASNGWSGSKALNGSENVFPTNTTTYTLTCTGPGGSAQASATVTVTSAPSQATINVTSNQSTSWIVSGPAGNYYNPGGTNATYTGPGGSYSINVDTLACYSMSITPGTTQSVNVGQQITFTISYTYVCTVTPPSPLPTLDLRFNGSNGPINNFASGSSGTLSWTVSDATSCTASGGTSGWNTPSAKAYSNGTHNQSSGAITSSMTFYLSCTGPGGAVNDAVAVNLAGQTQLCTDPAATNNGGPAPCTYPPGTTACTVSANPSSTASFPLNDVDVTVGIVNFNGTAHEYAVDCTNDGTYEEITYLTWSPNTFVDRCNYSGPATLRAHVRNLDTQGQADCTIPITSSNRTLTTSISAGSGSILSTSGLGISCPGDCIEVYANGTAVTLTATPSSGYVFAGWAGACTGTGSCSLTMTEDRSVSASFTLAPVFNYSLSNSGNSNVTKVSGNAFTQNTITKSLTAGVTQPVSITSIAGIPSPVFYSLAPTSGCSPNCTTTITFTVPPSTPVGTYTLTVNASPFGKQTSFNLVITGAPITVTCSASPSVVSLGQTVVWSSTVVGGVTPITRVWTGTNIPTNPAPSGSTYSRSYSTIGQKSAVLTVTGNDGARGSCTAVTVQVNFNPVIEEF